jgi:hypothetical protein
MKENNEEVDTDKKEEDGADVEVPRANEVNH